MNSATRRAASLTVAIAIVVLSTSIAKAEDSATAAQSASAPWQVEAQIGGAVWDAMAEGGRLYYRQGSRLIAMDPSEPGSPRELWRSRPALRGRVLGVREGVLVVHRRQGIEALRASPELERLSRHEPEGYLGRWRFSAEGFLALGNDTWRAEEDELRVELLDLRDPTNLQTVGRWTAPIRPEEARLGGLLWHDERLYVATRDRSDSRGALLTLARGGPSGLRLLARQDMDAPTSPIVAGQGLLLAMRQDAGDLTVEVYDAADPTNLRRLSGIPIARSLAGVQLDAERLTLLIGCVDGDWCDQDSAEIRVFDLADPAAPRELGRAPLEVSDVNGLALHEGFAYVSVYELGLAIADLRTPGAMRRTAILEAPLVGNASIHAAEGALLVDDDRWLDGERRLRTLRRGADGELELLGESEGIPPLVQQGARGFAARNREPEPRRWTSRLLRLDLSDPRQPRQLETDIELDERVHGMALSGDTLLLARRKQLLTVDVSEPGRERLLTRIEDPTQLASAVAAEGDRAYLLRVNLGLSAPSRLQVLSIGVPVAPGVLGETALPDREVISWMEPEILPLGDRVLVWGTLLLDVGDPSRPELLATVVDPAGKRATITAAATAGDRLFLQHPGCVQAFDLRALGVPRRIAGAEMEIGELAVLGDTLYGSSISGVEALPVAPRPGGTMPEACEPLGWRPAQPGLLPGTRAYLPWALTGW